MLQIRLRNALASPFLADANTSYEAADYSRAKGDFASCVVAQFGMQAKATTLDPLKPLPCADNIFDGIWLDGQALFRMDTDVLFSELKRIPDADGVIHVQESYGPGRLLKMILQDPEGNNGRSDVEDILIRDGHGDLVPLAGADGGIGPGWCTLFADDLTDNLEAFRNGLEASLARSALLEGLRHEGVCSFFTDKEPRRVLRKHNLTPDNALLAALGRCGQKPAGTADRYVKLRRCGDLQRVCKCVEPQRDDELTLERPFYGQTAACLLVLHRRAVVFHCMVGAENG